MPQVQKSLFTKSPHHLQGHYWEVQAVTLLAECHPPALHCPLTPQEWMVVGYQHLKCSAHSLAESCGHWWTGLHCCGIPDWKRVWWSVYLVLLWPGVIGCWCCCWGPLALSHSGKCHTLLDPSSWRPGSIVSMSFWFLSGPEGDRCRDGCYISTYLITVTSLSLVV